MNDTSIRMEVSAVAIVNKTCFGIYRGDAGIYCVTGQSADDIRQGEDEDENGDEDAVHGNKKIRGKFSRQVEGGSSILLCSPAFALTGTRNNLPELLFPKGEQRGGLYDPISIRMKLKRLEDEARRGAGTAGASVILISARKEGDCRADCRNND
jgi:hypothetical protein